ncbi:MAG: gamma-glutamyltransferase [Gammaproteobacteria bacterium]|nr:gamma-glutamyltransferase [Gammaproteobacteria bacterium]
MRFPFLHLGLCLGLAAGLFVSTVPAAPVVEDQARLSLDSVFSPELSRHGMVVSEEELASRVGAEILQQGGNAVDAAVAVGFALAVVLPEAGNLGGGGFMLVHLAEAKKTIAIDYRETAPAQARTDMYLDESGAVDKERLRYSHQSVAVPGTVAGLSHALARYGSMPLKQVIEPAVKLAEQGFVLKPAHIDTLKRTHEHFAQSEASHRIFLRPDGTDFEFGDRLVQKDLAWTLSQIRDHGPEAFYQGEIAERLVADMQAHDGLISREDLKNYRVVEREPVRGQYRGYEVASMPPPSSGGVHLIQLLNILEAYPIADLGLNSAESLHVMTEAMKLAYADRSKHLGDPDFVKVPLAGLASKAYAEKLRERISRNRATPSEKIQPGQPAKYESPQTTHFSVMDSKGNAVSNTYTLNFSYGTGITAQGTGILLNNQMDDFSAKPGEANAYGLIGDKANAIEPKKRPLSSMSPTIVFKDGKPYMVLGSPGGSTIITVVLQTLMNVLDHGLNIQAASSMPRIHHQWQPDLLRVEEGMSIDTVKLLKAKGHNVRYARPLGTTESILWDGKVFQGAADPRRQGGGAVGY